METSHCMFVKIGRKQMKTLNVTYQELACLIC